MKTLQPAHEEESESSIIKRHERLIRYVALPFARRVPLDDLMQEGRIALLAAARSWRASEGVKLWTYARKFVLGAMFRFVTRETVEGNVGDELLDSVEFDGPTPEDALEAGECAAIAARELSELSESERRVIRMRFVDDLDVRTIADSLGIPTMSAYDIYRRAIAKLRDRVEVRL